MVKETCTSELDFILDKERLNKEDIIFLLKLNKKEELNNLFGKADDIRKKYIGNEVFVRGVLEFSNYCKNDCLYCGIRKSNLKLKRYRIKPKGIVKIAENIEKFGFKTVLLQSGEDDFYKEEIIDGIIKSVLRKCDCRVALSIGERKIEEYKRFYETGARRCLIRFETSNKEIFKRLHPESSITKNSFEKRIELIKKLKKIGYQVGTGPMIGLPGQSIEDLAEDILLFNKLNIDMAGMGPFICHPNTPLAGSENGVFETSEIAIRNLPASTRSKNGDFRDAQKHAPHFSTGSVFDMSLKMIAVTRIVCKDIFISATTALQTTNKINGRELALQAGANLLMPNITPRMYRKLYQLYPNKVCIYENPYDCAHCVRKVIQSVGRVFGNGYGDSIRK